MAIQTIRGKPPPISYTDFEELSFYKRSLLAAKVTDDRLRSIESFEEAYHIELPNTVITSETLEPFLEDLNQKSWHNLKDILLLSYAEKQLGEEDQAKIRALCQERSISLKPVQERFLLTEEEMVKGVRVDTGQQHAMEQQELLRPRPQQDDVVVLPVRAEDGTSQASLPRGRGRPPKQPTHIVLTDGREPSTAITPSNYQTFSKDLDKTYWDDQSTSSLALDVIGVYLKGQKILYIEAKTHCERNLTLLMLPAIFISAACTVLSVSLESYAWGTILVSSLTAFNSFLLTLVNYLKLDARAEAHRVSSYQFDKLQTLCEFHSGKVLFFSDKTAIETVMDIEKKIKEIKDNNQFIIPEAVRDNFPVLYTTNVFTEVKKIENRENRLKQKLYALHLQLQSTSEKGELQKSYDTLLIDYINIRESYMKLDEAFNKEIFLQINTRRGWCKREKVQEVSAEEE